MEALKQPVTPYGQKANSPLDGISIINPSIDKEARRISNLLAGYMRDDLTSQQHDELDEWVGASDKNMLLFEELTDEKKVASALELLNDSGESLTKRLSHDREYIFARRSAFYYLKMFFLVLFSHFKRKIKRK